jgi:hypothetical protein
MKEGGFRSGTKVRAQKGTEIRGGLRSQAGKLIDALAGHTSTLRVAEAGTISSSA